MLRLLKSVFLILWFLVSLLPAEGTKRGIVDAVLQFDALYGNNTCYTEIELKVVRPGVERNLRMKFWSKNSGKIFVKVLEPEEYRGDAVLVVDKNIWTYSPKSRKVIKVKTEDYYKPWMDTDLMFIGMIQKFFLIGDYKFQEFMPQDSESGMDYIKGTPRLPDDDLGLNIILCYNKKLSVPKWFKIFSRNNRLVRTAFYNGFIEMGGKKVPKSLKIVPEGNIGYSTTINYVEINFPKDIPDSVFSLRNLRTPD